MDITLVLARFFGLYFTIAGIGFFVNSQRVQEAVKELLDSKMHQLFAGVLPLLIGAFLVSVHNRWDSGLVPGGE